MGLFILHRAMFDSSVQELSFFATAAGLQQTFLCQRSHHGTREMVNKMLADLGLANVSFSEWRIEQFVDRYLADDPINDHWQDIWLNSWLIRVAVEQPIVLCHVPNKLIRSYIHDNTWQAQPENSYSSPWIVVGDFYRQVDVVRAERALCLLHCISHNVSYINQLHAQFPELSLELLSEFYSAYDELIPLTSSVSVKRRNGWPYQLIISAPRPVDTSFFAEGAELAELFVEAVAALHGTTTWNELNERLIELNHLKNHFDTQPFSSQEASSLLRLLTPRAERYLEGWLEAPQSGLVQVSKNGTSRYIFKEQEFLNVPISSSSL